MDDFGFKSLSAFAVAFFCIGFCFICIQIVSWFGETTSVEDSGVVINKIIVTDDSSEVFKVHVKTENHGIVLVSVSAEFYYKIEIRDSVKYYYNLGTHTGIKYNERIEYAN